MRRAYLHHQRLLPSTLSLDFDEEADASARSMDWENCKHGDGERWDQDHLTHLSQLQLV